MENIEGSVMNSRIMIVITQFWVIPQNSLFLNKKQKKNKNKNKSWQCGEN